jgi:hypothetical protein
MAHAILIFDFGTNEEAAQQARHKIEGWKQGFRLGDKMVCKFEREESDEAAGEENGDAAEGKKSAQKQKAKKGHAEGKESGGHVRMLLRLGFSDHEKLSQQRWLDRIPNEEPFKSAKGETLRQGDPEFPKSAELFESLD